MAGAFRRFLGPGGPQLGPEPPAKPAGAVPPAGQAMPVAHKTPAPGGGPSISDERNALLGELQQKFSGATTPQLKNHYSTLIQRLQSHQAEDDIYDETLARTGSAEEAEQQLENLDISSKKARAGIMPTKPKR